MKPETQAKYDALLKEAVIKHGTLCDIGSWAYGYVADDHEALYEERKRGCKVYSDNTVDTGSWTDFDTFHQNSPRQVLDLTGVNCNCGRLLNRTVRWDVSPMDAIEKVLAIALGDEDE
jgi:hypothetical protein